MMLAILLDRGSTVKRDPEQAIFWTERAAANPARDTDPIKDLRPIDMQVLLGRLLVKSSDPAKKARGFALMGQLATAGRGDAAAYLAEAIRSSDPVQARALLEQAARTYPGYARARTACRHLDQGRGRPEGRTAGAVAVARPLRRRRAGSPSLSRRADARGPAWCTATSLKRCG